MNKKRLVLSYFLLIMLLFCIAFFQFIGATKGAMMGVQLVLAVIILVLLFYIIIIKAREQRVTQKK